MTKPNLVDPEMLEAANGDFDDDADPGLTIQVARASLDSAGSDPYAKHPLYPQYAGLAPEVRQALRNDFRVFLDVKKRGQLDGIVNAIYEQAARDCERDAQVAQKRQFERELEAAKDSTEYKMLLARKNARRTQQDGGAR